MKGRHWGKAALVHVKTVEHHEEPVRCLSLAGHHVVHWSRWRALAVLIVATVLMACCADLSTENIEPLLTHSAISQVLNLFSLSRGEKCGLWS